MNRTTAENASENIDQLGVKNGDFEQQIQFITNSGFKPQDDGPYPIHDMVKLRNGNMVKENIVQKSHPSHRSRQKNI